MLVARESELAAIGAALDAACAERASILRLVGPPGIGKTTLLDRAAEEAEGRGMHVVRLVALELEQDLPEAGLDILMLQLGAHGAARTPGGLLIALSQAAGDRPLLLMLDDIQWLDAQTLAAVSFATRRLMADPIAVLMAGRPESDRIGALAGVPRLELPALSVDEGVALLRSVVPAMTASTASQVTQALGGLPLALQEAAHLVPPDVLAGRAPLPVPIPVGPAVRDRYARGFDAMAPGGRRALVLLATAATTDPEVIREALIRSGLDLAALEPAEDAGLVQLNPVPTFIHPLARAAVHSAARPAELRQANAVLASVLTQMGDARGALRHRAASVPGPDPDLAAELEQLALHLASTPSARSEAADAALLAGRFAGDAGERWRLTVLAAECCSGDRALRLVDELGDVDLPADLRARATFVRVDNEGYAHPDEVREALVALADLPLGQGDRDLLDGHLVEHAMATLDLEEARSIADRLEQGAADDERWLTLFAAGMALTFVGDHARAVALLRRARDASASVDPRGLPVDQVVSWATIPGWLAEVDAEHAERFRTMDTVLRARQQPQAVGVAAFFSAERARREGRWDRAEALLNEAIDVAAAAGQEDAVAKARLACLLAARGQEAAVSRLVAAAREELDTWSPWSSGWLTQAQGALALTLGRPEEAARILAPVQTLPFLGRGVRDSIALSLVDLVEARVAAGELAGAADATADLAERLDGTVDPLGRALVARSRALVSDDPDAADALFEVAIQEHERTAEVFEQARTLLLRGEQLRRSRRARLARDPLGQALGTFERLRTPDWAERARRELTATGERIGPRTDGRTAELTPQETRVALAVAEGLTNAEVAQQLFLSVKTVEFHLGRVYRKLDVRSRGGLARALAERGL